MVHIGSGVAKGGPGGTCPLENLVPPRVPPPPSEICDAKFCICHYLVVPPPPIKLLCPPCAPQNKKTGDATAYRCCCCTCTVHSVTLHLKLDEFSSYCKVIPYSIYLRTAEPLDRVKLFSKPCTCQISHSLLFDGEILQLTTLARLNQPMETDMESSLYELHKYCDCHNLIKH